MNKFFSYTIQFIPGTLIRAEDVNSAFQSIETAFDSAEARLFDATTGGTVQGNVAVTGDLSASGDLTIKNINSMQVIASGRGQFAELYVPGTATFNGDIFAPTRPFGEQSNRVATVNFVNAAMFQTALPGQSGNGGKFLTTDGSNAKWENGLQTVRKPTAIYPLIGQLNAVPDGFLEATAYAPIYSIDARLHRVFQVAAAGDGMFSAPVFTAQVAADSVQLSPALALNANFIWRCKDVSVNGQESPWMETQSFKTADVMVQTPTVVVTGQPSSVTEEPDIGTSLFAVSPTGFDTHQSTDWEVRKLSDNSLVYSSYNDTVNKISLTIPDLDILQPNTDYVFRARHRGATYQSNYGSVTAKTLSIFPDVFGQEFVLGYQENAFVRGTAHQISALDSTHVAAMHNTLSRETSNLTFGQNLTLTGGGKLQTKLSVLHKETGVVVSQVLYESAANQSGVFAVSSIAGELQNSGCVVLCLTTTTGVVGYERISQGNFVFRVFTFNSAESSLVLGPEVSLPNSSGATNHVHAALLNSETLVIGYRSTAQVSNCVVATVTGVGAAASVVFGVSNSGVIFSDANSAPGDFALAGLSSTSALIIYRNSQVLARVLTISGSGASATISAGTTTVTAGAGTRCHLKALSSSSALFVALNGLTTVVSGVLTVSGTSVTANGSTTVLNNSNFAIRNLYLEYFSNANTFYVYALNYSGVPAQIGANGIYRAVISVSGVTVTVNSSTQITSGDTDVGTQTDVLAGITHASAPTLFAPTVFSDVMVLQGYTSRQKRFSDASEFSYFPPPSVHLALGRSLSLENSDANFHFIKNSCVLQLDKKRALVFYIAKRVSNNIADSALLANLYVDSYSNIDVNAVRVSSTALLLVSESQTRTNKINAKLLAKNGNNYEIVFGVENVFNSGAISMFQYDISSGSITPKFSSSLPSGYVFGASSAKGVFAIRATASVSEFYIRGVNRDSLNRATSFGALQSIGLAASTMTTSTIGGDTVVAYVPDVCMLTTSLCVAVYSSVGLTPEIALIELGSAVSSASLISRASPSVGNLGDPTGFQLRWFIKRVSDSRALLVIEGATQIHLLTFDIVLGGFRFNARLTVTKPTRDISLAQLSDSVFLLNNQIYRVNQDGSVSAGASTSIPFSAANEYLGQINTAVNTALSNEQSRRGSYLIHRKGSAVNALNSYRLASFTIGKG